MLEITHMLSSKRKRLILDDVTTLIQLRNIEERPVFLGLKWNLELDIN